MKIKKFTEENIRDYIKYLKIAHSLEPSIMRHGLLMVKVLLSRLLKDNDRLCKLLFAYKDDKVIGRLEYHFIHVFRIITGCSI